VVAVLAGGTGGAKLARGLYEVVGDGELVVIANTADDIDIYGLHVSPDPDLVCYWLADIIDERGWGISGDSWQVMDQLTKSGFNTWFNLGDRDLAMCLIRTKLLREGQRLTQAQASLANALGVSAGVLPMCDEPVQTEVQTAGGWQAFQRFMIEGRACGAIEGVRFKHIDSAQPTQEAQAALANAEAIIIGPSNPVISIGPILAVDGMREVIASAQAPVVAVSPFVGGHAVKGPTEAFCDFARIDKSATGIAQAYEGLIDGVVADERTGVVPSLTTDVLMNSAKRRRELAETVLEFAGSLKNTSER
jgi:LPPG:FO 2-phospho-L-lactate transferase